MITDNQTDLLCFADCLPKMQSVFYDRLTRVLKSCKKDFDLLPGTKDIWAVDFMPIQISRKHFVRFTYNPDYLQSEKWRKTISNTDAICEAMQIEIEKSTILVDGGNVVRTKSKAIMCDKVFRENPSLTEKSLIKEIVEQLQIDQLIIIPTHPKDEFGHSDGMLRFLDDHTVLINDYSRESHEFQRRFRMALHNANLDWEVLPYNPYNNKRNIQAQGVYINYLQMHGLILLPIFSQDEDSIAENQIQQLFSGQGLEIRTIDCTEIAKLGGLMNCISWNILDPNDQICQQNSVCAQY